MRRILVLFILGVLVLGLCCSSTALFLDGSFLPFKPCRPITYPDGIKTRKRLSYTTSDSLNKVLTFYDNHLQIQPWPAEVGMWNKEQLTDTKYLYSCYGVDINRLTTETGCIYISIKEDNLRIETKLFRSEGSNTPCPREAI